MQRERSWVREGLVVGFIAYAAVAVFYSAFDLLASRGMLFTVDLMGRALFQGLRDPAVLMFPITTDLRMVFGYNAVHLAVSLSVGLTVVRLVEVGERDSVMAPRVLLVIIAGFVLTVLGVGYVTAPLRELLPWWSIILANALATACAGWYLLRRRPGVLVHLTDAN